MADYFLTILMICQLDLVFVKVALTLFCHCAFFVIWTKTYMSDTRMTLTYLPVLVSIL